MALKTMFFSEKPLCVYLSLSALEIFLVQGNRQERFIYPKDLVKKAEIADENRFKEELTKFLSGLSLKKGKVIILLSRELVFAKDFNIYSITAKTEQKEFLDSVPINKDNIARISVKNKEKIYVYAANRKFYEMVDKIFDLNGFKIYSVTPISAFTNNVIEDMNIQDVKKILLNGNIIKKFNFLEKPEMYQLLSSKKPDRRKKQNISLLISMAIVGLAIGYIFIWSGKIAIPFRPVPVPTKTTLKLNPTSKPTLPPSPKALDKSSVKIEVLNGSGIAGQAGNLRDVLLSDDYKNVTAGNAENPEQKNTLIYDKQVSEKMLSEIQSVLKKSMPDIALREASQSADYDIIITTGRGSQ